MAVIISDHRGVPWKVARQEWILRQYRLFNYRVPAKNRVVCYMTDKTERLGLADRLRTLRLAFVISQENNMDLSIYHDCGFLLEDYLQPNEIDWRVKPQDICFGLNQVGLIFFQKHTPKLPLLRKEWHVYVADNVLMHILNQGQKKRYSDYSVFWKMFKLAPWLAEEVNSSMSSYNLSEDGYVAVHFRFCNFFEKVERIGECKTSARDKENMICCILNTLKKIYHEYNNEKQLVLFSDSNYVLNCTYPEYVTVLSGQVGHVANCHGNDELVKKTFVDLFIMSKSCAIHRITGNGLYGGNFSREAALIGAKRFVDTPLVTWIPGTRHYERIPTGGSTPMAL